MSLAASEPETAAPGWQRDIWRLLATVRDPEIPVLSITDLGIVRYVRGASEDCVRVGLTPTYSGCPATDVIRKSVEQALACAGFAHAVVETVLAPAWTSDWLTSAARAKLCAYGIAPPVKAISNPKRLFSAALVACPRCRSEDTRRVSEFGSTPCKAHYQCCACLEPFDYFKCI
jgi:ring-1,2-phenylacetyl-CoA epoxidase subunit PaaD